MYTSKLGNKYPMAEMQQNDQAAQRELKRLRGLRDNNRCADCGSQDNSWSSVSHGVFICITCADVHRSVGTHVTKVKGCTGTYLWGPDELEKMRTIGNHGGDEIYGAERINPGASKKQKEQFVVDKYEKRVFVGKSASGPIKPATVIAKVEQPDKPLVRKVEPVEPMIVSKQVAAEIAPMARKVEIPDSLFDDLFNEAEDSYFGSSSLPLKSSPATPTACPINDTSLDAFLNATLNVKSPAAPLSDPFSDWPAF